MSRSFLFLFLFFSIYSSSVATADLDVVIYVDHAYRPYNYEENGEVKGMYVDLLNTVFSRMNGFNVTLEAVPWARAKRYMEDGKGLAIVPVFFHGHDWPYLHPYSIPFSKERIDVICNENILKTPRLNWPDDYKGLIIGKPLGDGWGGAKFNTMVAAGDIYLQEAKTTTLLIRKLARKRYDCVLAETLSFNYYLDQLKKEGGYNVETGDVVFKKGAIVSEGLIYMGYSRPAREAKRYPYQFDFMHQFDAIMFKMMASGEAKKIIESYQE